MIKFASALIAVFGVASAIDRESENNRATDHLNLNIPQMIEHNMQSVHHAETFDRDHLKD